MREVVSQFAEMRNGRACPLKLTTERRKGNLSKAKRSAKALRMILEWNRIRIEGLEKAIVAAIERRGTLQEELVAVGAKLGYIVEEEAE